MAGGITKELTVSVTELARTLGITARRIHQLLQDGVLTTVERGRLNLCESVQMYIAYLTKGNRKTDEDAKVDKTRRQSEAILKESKARIAKLEADELDGRMHRSEDVEAITSDLIFAMRNALSALPGRLAIDTAAVSTAAETSAIIRTEVHKIMSEIAEYQYDPAKYRERVRARKDWAGEDDE